MGGCEHMRAQAFCTSVEVGGSGEIRGGPLPTLPSPSGATLPGAARSLQPRSREGLGPIKARCGSDQKNADYFD